MTDSLQVADLSRASLVSNCHEILQVRLPGPVYCPKGGDKDCDPEAVSPKLRRRVLGLRVAWKKMPTAEHSYKRPGIWASDEDLVDDDRYQRIEQLNLESHPDGYPRAAVFMNSDIDNRLFRRFGSLHTLSLLYMQAEITKLETKLEQMNKEDSIGEDVWKLQSYPIMGDSEGHDRRRAELMALIKSKLKEYDELLLRDHQLSTLRRPTKRQHGFLFNYFYNEHPVTEEDERFIYKRDDFVCLTDHPEFGWFDDILSKLMDRSFLKSIFVTEEDQAKTTNPYIHFYSRTRLGRIVSTLIAFLSTMLLLIPVYILITTSLSMPIMATIVLAFVLLCAICVSVFTSAKRYEVFAATAAYCAVLVVFLGNLQQIQQSNGDKLPNIG